MRRLIFCFDGSWNGLQAGNMPTNVQLVAESVKPVDADDGTVQIVYYDEGVGTRSDEVFRGGAFGKGLLENLREAYRFLIFNYQQGDEIFCFGFSRGGFTAMAFVGLIRSLGILSTSSANEIDEGFRLYRESAVTDGVDSERLRDFRAKHCPRHCVSPEEIAWRLANVPGWDDAEASVIQIKYLGVWDAVGSLGWKVVRALFDDKTEQFYKQFFTDIDVIAISARHAVSIDERRKAFKPTLWNRLDDLNGGLKPTEFSDPRPYQQKWFPGDHGSVGGGGEYDGLSRGALQWIIEGAAIEKLAFNVVGDSRISKIRYDINTPLHNTQLSAFSSFKASVKAVLISADRGGPNRIEDVGYPARRMWALDQNYRPKNLEHLASALSADAANFKAVSIPPEIGFDEYVVQEGDDLSRISKTHFGEAKFDGLIYKVNADRLDSSTFISPGEKIRLPKKPFPIA